MTQTQPTGPPRFVGVLFAGLASIFVIAGWWCAIVQDHRLRHGQPVQATVTRVEMITHGGKFNASSQEPVIQYQYTATGTSHESTDVFPTHLGGLVEESLRDALFASLDERTTPAWYVDDAPSRAYLIHERLFSPYAMILFANVFLLAGLVVALPPKTSTEPGPGHAKARRRRAITFIWLILGITAIAHYLLQWPTRWRGDFLAVTPIWLIISLALIAWWRGARRLEL